MFNIWTLNEINVRCEQLRKQVNIADTGYEKEKLQETEEFKRRLEQLKSRALRNFYIRKVIHPQITQEKMQERYVDYLARFEPQTEIRARHILVEKEDEAKAKVICAEEDTSEESTMTKGAKKVD